MTTRSSLLAPLVGVLVGITIAVSFIQQSRLYRGAPSTQSLVGQATGGTSPPAEPLPLPTTGYTTDNLPTGPVNPGNICKFSIRCTTDAGCQAAGLGTCQCTAKDPRNGNCTNSTEIASCSQHRDVGCTQGQTCTKDVPFVGIVCTSPATPVVCASIENPDSCADGACSNPGETCQVSKIGGDSACICAKSLTIPKAGDYEVCTNVFVRCTTDQQCKDAGLGETCTKKIGDVEYRDSPRCEKVKDTLECATKDAACILWSSDSADKVCVPPSVCGNGLREFDEECEPGGTCYDSNIGSFEINNEGDFEICMSGMGWFEPNDTATCSNSCKKKEGVTSSASQQDWCCMDYECRPISGGGVKPNF